MTVLHLNDVYLVDKDHITCTAGGKLIKRTIRKHTKEIRNLMKNGVYCFEIQGILYWYCSHASDTGVYPVRLTKFKEPENFRSEERKSSILIAKKERNGIFISIPETPLKAVQSVTDASEEEKKPVNSEKEVRHKQYETIKTCIEQDIPVFLTGPAGSGKNYTLEQIAWDLGLEFYFTNSVQQEYKLTGFIDAGGVYHETEFYRAFVNGGIFFLDELDASIPEVLVLLNAAIANRYFEFPTGKVYAHKNFRVVAAGNTVGSGSNELYTGRMVLDMATMDRFAVIDFDYDKTIELHLAEGNNELVEFIHTMREEAEQNGIRTVISYRCIAMITKLENTGMNLKTILSISVLRGMDPDTVNCFSRCLYGKYGSALRSLQSGC